MLRWLFALVLLIAAPAAAQVPHLKDGRLIVDGKPFLILGGELGNSSASHREWLRPKWAKLKAANLNTVLAPISWELIEPVEGKFDFSSMDWLIEDARANDMRLVILWFGAWKNSMSTYVPTWVKRDEKRFPRTFGADGKAQEILSAFGMQTRDADARAFAALMRHLKQVDGKRHTVIMVQVENEIGFLPMARERSPVADAAFMTWEGGEEEFTAHHYARFVEALAAAGKREYDLPMYVNGAQARPGKKPGEYPSGGPLAHLMEIWRKGAPSIDFIAPDIYFPNFGQIAAGYRATGNPFFIPEANNAGDGRAAANALHAIGALGAFGFSPFSIENLPEGDRLGPLYAMLDGMAPSLFAAKGRAGFAAPVTFENGVGLAPQVQVLGDYRFTVSFVDPWTAKDKQMPAEHGGIILWMGGEDYLIAGGGITVTVEPAEGKGRAGFDLVEEGSFVDGRWVAGRRLNGDQTHQGRHIRLPPDAMGVQRVRLYRYG
ncbi:MAG: hypothetical protein EOP60_08635 [Sphingomonadales bacterium]|nr:MAG: hypothetical protein EOP60_08635 [Sphingomonadales bacterium]